MGLTIELAGLELYGRHGVLEEERRHGQRFVLDVRFEVGDEAAISDELADAVDYRDVVAVVRDVFEARSYRLLEALAAAIADELVIRFALATVEVRVRKPDVEVTAPVEFAAVTARRG